MILTTNPWKSRLIAAAVHLAITACVALLAAALVFGLWYPYPYRDISGGRALFELLVGVDVVLGPLLTFTVFNRSKPWKELRRDLAIIALLQLGALTYGVWTMALARPVHLVFEIDRFRVVHAVDIPDNELPQAPPALQSLPWRGPTLLSVRDFKNPQESFDATMAAVQGAALGARPSLWQSYAAATPQILQRAQPLAALKARFPQQTVLIDQALKAQSAATGDVGSVVYVPMVGRETFWTVLLDGHTAEVLAFVPLDSF